MMEKPDDMRELVVSSFAAPAPDGGWKLVLVVHGLDDEDDAAGVAAWLETILAGDPAQLH